MTFRELNISPNPTIAEIGILLEWLMKLPENLDGEKKEALHYESSGGKPNGMLRSFTLSPERMMRSRSAFQEVQNKLHGFLRSHASRSCLHFVENNPTYTEFLAQTPLAIAEDEPMLVWTVMCQEMTDELQKLEKQCAGNDQAIQHLKSLRDYFCDASRYPTLQEVWHMLLQERQVWPMLEAPEMAKGKTVMNDALARLAIDMMDQLRNLPEFPFTLTTQDGTQLSIFIPNKELETEIARNSIAAMPLALYAGSGQVTERYVPIAVQRVVGIGGFKSFTNQWQTFCDAVDSALVKQYPGRSQKWYSGVMQSNGLALGNKQVDMLKPYLEHAMPELGSLLCLNAMKEDGQSIQPAEELQKICVAFHIAYQPEWSVPQTAEDMNALMKLAHLYQ